MGDGSPGALGAAAVRHVEEAASKGRGCVRDHSLVENPALETNLTFGTAMRRDAQVKKKQPNLKKKQAKQ